MFGTKENAELLWLFLKALVSGEEVASVEDVPLRYASLRSEGQDKHPQMRLVLG